MLSLFSSGLAFNAPATALTTQSRAQVSMKGTYDALADFGKLPASIDEGVAGALPMMVGGSRDRLPRGKTTGVPEPVRTGWMSGFMNPSTVGVFGKSIATDGISAVKDPSAPTFAINAAPSVPTLQGATGKVVPTGRFVGTKPLESDFVYARGAMRGNGKA